MDTIRCEIKNSRKLAFGIVDYRLVFPDGTHRSVRKNPGFNLIVGNRSLSRNTDIYAIKEINENEEGNGYIEMEMLEAIDMPDSLYLGVRLPENRFNKKEDFIHKIVCFTYSNGRPNSGDSYYVVHHIDNDIYNNTASNLVYSRDFANSLEAMSRVIMGNSNKYVEMLINSLQRDLLSMEGLDEKIIKTYIQELRDFAERYI